MGRPLQRVNDYEYHDTVYQSDGEPSFLEFVIIQEADGTGIVKHKGRALEADTVLGDVAGVLLLVPSKAHSDDVPTILHVREGRVKWRFSAAEKKGCCRLLQINLFRLIVQRRKRKRAR
jgi:hypothetical protein